ncbi:LANO_0F12508g1_1 [Lachancea nothofagi CBS 11611]|uniref:LANO_0F12508g1_1 n=1 Tax=Lachancea nothofagi CBS 11611 TaxID=1266666 RepID=A0A1G4KBE2_9SACH|nr:LANO_0F12508g1_1 [Lachancea nothofagi CBS 11611]
MVGDFNTDLTKSSDHAARRKSSTIKHALTSMIRTGSNNSNLTNNHLRPGSQSGASSTAASHGPIPSFHNPLMAFGGSPRLSHHIEDHGVAPNELALAENSPKPLLSDDEYEEADIEWEENLSEPEDLQSHFSFNSSRSLANIPIGHKYLLEYLSERGFLQPKNLTSDGGISIYMATSSEVVFLPTVSSQDDEYLTHLAMINGSETSPEAALTPIESLTTEQQVTTESASTAPETSSIDADGKNVLFNIAVIVSFKKATALTTLKAELYSRARIYWQHGVPPEKNTNEEYYTIGELNWELTDQNYNLYVPHHLSTKDKIVENPDVQVKPTLFKNKDDLLSQKYRDRKKSDASFASSFHNTVDPQTFEPGEYVFLLPVFFSSNIPETVYLPSGRISYNFRCASKLSPNNTAPVDSKSDISSSNSGMSHTSEDRNIENSNHNKFSSNKLLRKVRDQFQNTSNDRSANSRRDIIRGDRAIKVVRIPPSISESTADKPVYINRVWNDALSYEVSLAKKYVPVGSKIPIRIKLAPTSKNISIKRVRVSVIEKITYVSKNLKYEFNQTEAIANDPYNPYYSEFVCRRKQERILPLWEIRSKEKGSKAMKEDVVNNCRSENLLSYCSYPSEDKNTDLVDALTIESTLTFPKFMTLDRKTSKSVPPYGIDEFSSVNQTIGGTGGASSRRNSTASGVIGFLAGRRVSTPFASRRGSAAGPVEPARSKTTFKSGSDVAINAHTRLNEPKRGLYLDCVSFKNIHVTHKLEIMLRISKTGAKTANGEKHYEVLIDTPIFIVSDLCGDSNTELPTYDVAVQQSSHEDFLPPSFEEAVSVPGSPLASPMGSPNLQSSYDPDDLSIQQLSLSRATTQNHSAEPSVLNAPRASGRRFSNIDCLMNSPVSGPSSPIFRKGYEMGPSNNASHLYDPLSDDGGLPKYEK